MSRHCPARRKGSFVMSRRTVLAVVCWLFAGLVSAADSGSASRLPDAAPAAVGLDAERLARIDGAVEGAIGRGQLPGAVVLVIRHGKVAFRKAYGHRTKQPAETPM